MRWEGGILWMTSPSWCKILYLRALLQYITLGWTWRAAPNLLFHKRCLSFCLHPMRAQYKANNQCPLVSCLSGISYEWTIPFPLWICLAMRNVFTGTNHHLLGKGGGSIKHFQILKITNQIMNEGFIWKWKIKIILFFKGKCLVKKNIWHTRAWCLRSWCNLCAVKTYGHCAMVNDELPGLGKRITNSKHKCGQENTTNEIRSAYANTINGQSL